MSEISETEPIVYTTTVAKERWKKIKSYLIHIGLFLVTFITTTLAGVEWTTGQLPPYEFNILVKGLPYSLSILLIITFHEFGHYFAARYHKLAVSLPFFIPLPIPGGFSPGTMGAFIRLKALVPDRRKLFDVGVAGPLAGLVIAIPLLLWGVSTSPVKIPPPNTAYYVEGNSLLYVAVKYIFFGKFLPDSLTGEDIFINSVTAAAWFGLLVTRSTCCRWGNWMVGTPSLRFLATEPNASIRLWSWCWGCSASPVCHPCNSSSPGFLQSVTKAGLSGWR